MPTSMTLWLLPVLASPVTAISFFTTFSLHLPVRPIVLISVDRDIRAAAELEGSRKATPHSRFIKRAYRPSSIRMGGMCAVGTRPNYTSALQSCTAIATFLRTRHPQILLLKTRRGKCRCGLNDLPRHPDPQQDLDGFHLVCRSAFGYESGRTNRMASRYVFPAGCCVAVLWRSGTKSASSRCRVRDSAGNTTRAGKSRIFTKWDV